jgi:hypothetical protein
VRRHLGDCRAQLLVGDGGVAPRHDRGSARERPAAWANHVRQRLVEAVEAEEDGVVGAPELHRQAADHLPRDLGRARCELERGQRGGGRLLPAVLRRETREPLARPLLDLVVPERVERGRCQLLEDGLRRPHEHCVRELIECIAVGLGVDADSDREREIPRGRFEHVAVEEVELCFTHRRS